MKRFVPVLIMLVAAGLFAALLMQPKEAPTGKTGHMITNQVLSTREGKTADLLTGQRQVINIFASWCVPCIAEIEQLAALQQQGIAVTGIAYKDQPAALETFLTDHGNPYAHILLDDAGQAALALSISGVPETFVLDADGKVIWHVVGVLMDDDVVAIKRLVQP